MIKGYIQFHKLVALWMGLWFLLIVLSGLLLVFRGDSYTLYTGALAGFDEQASIESIYMAHQDACATLRIDHHNSVLSAFPVYEVRCDEAAYLGLQGTTPVPGSGALVAIFEWIFRFHLELFLPGGRYLQAVAGAFLFSMSVTGLLIWFKMPGKTLKKIRFQIKTPKPALYFQGHRAVGFWVAILAMPVIVTGIVLATKSLVPVSQITPSLHSQTFACADRLACLRHFMEQVPDHVIKSVRQTEAKPDQLVILSQKQQVLQGPKDVHTVKFGAEGQSRVSAVTPEMRTAWGTFTSWMYPLHTGKVFSLAGKLYVFLIGLGYLVLMYFGYAFWYAKGKRGRR